MRCAAYRAAAVYAWHGKRNLVTSQMRERRGTVDRTAQTHGNGAQDRVSERVAERSVDVLEPIQVDSGHRQLARFVPTLRP